MTSGAIPICVSCSHWQYGSCTAYPEGIPEEIMIEGFDHRKPFGGEQTENGEPILYALNPERSKALEAYEGLRKGGNHA